MKIDKNIPMPDINRHRELKYPWANMKIGDSLLFTGLTNRSVSPQAYRASRILGFKFTSRKVPEGIRVWRIK